MIICFTGIDGSGKTMQAQRLVARLNAAGRPARYVWTGGRAYLSRPLIWLAKAMLRAPRPAGQGGAALGPADAGARYRSYLAATRTIFRRPWLAAIWRQISLIEHTAEILAGTLPHLLRGRVVVCDRYVYDSLIGIAVLAGTSPAALPRAMRLPAVYPLPRPALWLLIDLPAETAFARRSDVVDVEFLERRAPLYRAAAAALGARVVDGAAAPDAVERAVWAAVWPLLGGLAAVDGGTT
jgi:thymidylate kinase